MLSSSELAQLRADLEELLPDTCTIQADGGSVDSAGHVTPSWSNTATGVACRLDPFTVRSDSRGVIAQQERTRTYYTLTLPYNTTIEYGNRVIFGSLTLEIVQLFTTHSLHGVVRALVAEMS
ncbi:MAG: head-tail adaptor protein [Anaerolineae bacterium]|nr:head-tail adaptor protein [Anaerolineae bacterium]